MAVKFSFMTAEEVAGLLKAQSANGNEANVHKSFASLLERSPDFEVEYCVSPDPSLSSMKLFQGMRFDFMYEGDDPAADGVHMIYPELLDAKGNVITDKRVEASSSGRALMWIIPGGNAERHRGRIKEGVFGYWMVGSKKFARVKVVKVSN